MADQQSAALLCLEQEGTQTLALLDECNRLLEYSRQPVGAGDAGALVLGRIERVVPALDAAFVQIGQERNGFLPLKESESFRQRNPQASASMRAGAEVLVQIQKEAHGEKGALLTQDIAMAGSYLLFLPRNTHIGCSKRVTDASERERLLLIGNALSNGEFGLVMRQAALSATHDELTDELQALQAAYHQAAEVAPYRRAPATLYRQGDTLGDALRDLSPRMALRVLTNLPPREGISERVRWEQRTESEVAAELARPRVREAVKQALSRKVALPGGATLVFDECEALTAIDVNSAANTQGGGDFALRQNLSVCDELARQLRLRAIGGVVVVDFMDMPNDRQRAAVAEALTAALESDRVKTVVHGFTSLGLMELTRKRTGASLRERMTAPCPRCNGAGTIEPEGETLR